MRESDSAEFIKAKGKEVQSHTENQVWELVPRSSVPPGTKILPAVWAMKRKRRIATREVYKWKARLNIDGSKQEEGVNYWETFSPVASWAAIRMVLITTLIHAWYTKQLMLCWPTLKQRWNVNSTWPSQRVLKRKVMPKTMSSSSRRICLGRCKQADSGTSILWTSSRKLVSFQVRFMNAYSTKASQSLFSTQMIQSCQVQTLKNWVTIVQDMKAVGLNLTVEGGIFDFLGVQIDRINRTPSISHNLTSSMM